MITLLPSNIIIIEGGAAREFLESAHHPDPEMIRRRDELFAQFDRIAEAYNFRTEANGDMTIDISGID